MEKILLLGGGYASLSFIKNLNKNTLKKYDITLISKEDYHYQSVLLHQVVSSGKNININYKEILPQEVTFIKDQILEIKENEVVGLKAKYDYDFLIIGLGFNSDDFKIPGVKEYAFDIVDFKNSFTIYEKMKNYDNNLEIAVCGGGFSGIELLGNLAHDLKKINKNFKLKCIEFMPTILPIFDKDLALQAQLYLEKLGIEFYLNSKIIQCQKDGVIIQKNNAEEKINANFILWTAGVQGNPVIGNSSFFNSQRNKIEINAFLNPLNQEKPMNNIFVLGDCALLKDANNKAYAPTAQLANQQSQYLAKRFNNDFKFNDFFHYQNKGILCSLGENYAIGVIKNKSIKGSLASYIKKFIELQWLLKLKGLKALLG
ncbi:FAD-dependent oxidoreductase [Campylobacter sp. VicNov18]|uniref:NAD(P)/FAD-dependent oxidoreductase n=1 Tax=Campylobacter bilis TaxID=2691918 RepID=UPI00130E542C|nr:FAD-dependent oxidoreductase [Campylobacter bilis]MPV63414.1 hypothetical protein [Campylobacter hepaticus]MBM0636913.1 hypothetical protein [Campylobacter bilis]MCC8277624.1 FAD-dependent oxidoreductase [Campylobacter bilis]MCC8299233.1 FAD-dependent oxidoreductase [Campylobacter bilis]MCC8300533.1 FAD-dependent oxidoreductase [Campylobacter bilis]